MTDHGTFCGVRWHTADGGIHSCLKREGHDPPHWCCDPSDGYPGGDNWTGPIWVTVKGVLEAARAAAQKANTP